MQFCAKSSSKCVSATGSIVDTPTNGGLRVSVAVNLTEDRKYSTSLLALCCGGVVQQSQPVEISEDN